MAFFFTLVTFLSLQRDAHGSCQSCLNREPALNLLLQKVLLLHTEAVRGVLEWWFPTSNAQQSHLRTPPLYSRTGFGPTPADPFLLTPQLQQLLQLSTFVQTSTNLQHLRILKKERDA